MRVGRCGVALLVAVVGLLAVGGRAAEADPPSAPATADAGVGAMTIDALAAEYRRLRKIRGHMSGGAGHWVDDVDSAGGKKERVMAELGQRLGHGVPRARVVALMGAPDDVQRADAGVLDESLVYFWRGAHDYLVFDVSHGNVVRSRWYAALE